MALVACAVPKQQIFDNIKEAILQCEIYPDDKSKEDELSAYVQMYMLKRIVDKYGLEKLLKDWSQFEEREKLFNVTIN